jgi:hypothetical protein
MFVVVDKEERDQRIQFKAWGRLLSGRKQHNWQAY